MNSIASARARARRGAPVAVALAVSAAISLLVASCSASKQADNTSAAPSSTTPAPSPVGALRAGPADTAVKDGGKIVYGLDGEPEGLDPTRYAFSQSGHAVASAVYDSLADLDANGNAVPYLATGFEPNTDFTEWTIGLPTGVKFHDGTPFNVESLFQVWDAYKASAITGPIFTSFVDSYQKKDDTHVVVKLKKPFRNLPVMFATQIGYVPAPAMLTDTSLAKKPVGTGPFVFAGHEDGKFWSFTKNAEYRQKGLPHLDAIEFRPVPDHQERDNMLQSGDLDMLQTIGGKQIIELRNNSSLKRVENQHGDKAFVMMNTTQPPFNNLTARQAVAYATDSAKWRKDIYQDVTPPANSPFGPGQPGYLEDNGFPKFDLAKAKELVQKYQAESGQPLEFTYLAAADPTNAGVAQAFTSNFEQAGMKVTIKELPQINLLASVATGSFQLSQFRIYGQPNPDADTHFYAGWSIVPGISVNFPRYANPDIDAAINDALASGDQAQRAKDYETISKILAAQVPYVWLGQHVWMLAAHPRVNGLDGAMNGSLSTVGPKMWIQSLSIDRNA